MRRVLLGARRIGGVGIGIGHIYSRKGFYGRDLLGRWEIGLVLDINLIYFFVNEYSNGLCLGWGDLDLGCGKRCGKVGKWWGFASGLGCGKVGERFWGGFWAFWGLDFGVSVKMNYPPLNHKKWAFTVVFSTPLTPKNPYFLYGCII
jgi:hypothetical protein